jgi:hypothetical protein
MYHFTVDQAVSDGCQVCCCEKLSLKPGTVNKVTVSYVPWAAPIGQLHCNPQFVLEQMETCPVPMTGNLPPSIVAPVEFTTPMNTLLEGVLGDKVADPESAPTTFKLLPLYGPQHGTLILHETGMFDYTPVPNYKGPDSFYASASDGTNTFVFETRIGVEQAASPPTPSISIISEGVQVDQRYHMISFPVKVSPGAGLCEVWRLTVLQSALDCSCFCFNRTDCFDIGIAKC